MGRVFYTNKLISKKMKVASSFFERLVGLMFSNSMKGFDSLLITKCNSIHTFFMRYAIDVVFLNNKYEIIRTYYNLKPWRMTRLVFGATQVLELRAGDLPQDVKIGDRLDICIS